MVNLIITKQISFVLHTGKNNMTRLHELKNNIKFKQVARQSIEKIIVRPT